MHLLQYNTVQIIFKIQYLNLISMNETYLFFFKKINRFQYIIFLEVGGFLYIKKRTKWIQILP